MLRHLASTGWVVPGPVGEPIQLDDRWYCLTRYGPGRAAGPESAGAAPPARRGPGPAAPVPARLPVMVVHGDLPSGTAIEPVYRAFRVHMAAWQLERGRRTGQYDLAMIERQLAMTGTAPA